MIFIAQLVFAEILIMFSQTSLIQSVQTCLTLKMKLWTPLLIASKISPIMAAISGNFEFIALQYAYILVFYFPIITGKLKQSLSFWTSGANEGEKCEMDQPHTWCTLGTRFQRSDVSATWTNASKRPSDTERCVTLESKADGSFGLDFSQCSSTKSVLCEV